MRILSIRLFALILTAGLPALAAAQGPAWLATFGGLGSGPGQFNFAHHMAVSATTGNEFVGDLLNHRVQKFNPAGTYLTQWGALGTANGQFNHPLVTATDAAESVYVLDKDNHRVQKFASVSTPVVRSSWGAVKARFR